MAQDALRCKPKSRTPKNRFFDFLINYHKHYMLRQRCATNFRILQTGHLLIMDGGLHSLQHNQMLDQGVRMTCQPAMRPYGEIINVSEKLQ